MVGTECGLTDVTGVFVDSFVTELNVTSLINKWGRNMSLKLSNKFPTYNKWEDYFNTIVGVSVYPFSTNLSKDLHVLNYVGVKYDSSATNYTKASRTLYNKEFKYDTDTSNSLTTHPKYIFDNDDTGLAGIRILPTPTVAVTNGIYARYQILPEPLVEANDEFINFPELLNDCLLEYVCSDVWKLKRDFASRNQVFQGAQLLENDFWRNFDPKGSDEPARFTPNKVFEPYRR
jgi:hypothetical protein